MSTLINHLYNDMLSGEFSPISDPHGSVHTMGKLALSTFRKGIPRLSMWDEPFIQKEYTPHWAPNVLSKVRLYPTREDERADYRLEYVSLAVKNDPKSHNQVEFRFDRGIPAKFVMKRTDTDYEDTESYSLVSSNLSHIRATVVEYAEVVFSQAHLVSLLEV